MTYPPPRYEAYPMNQQHAVAFQPQAATAPPTVIVTQPSNQQTTIINNNLAKPHGFPVADKQWSTSLFDCFQDIPSCCLGTCFPWCLACWVASRYNETCCLGWFGAPTMIALRTKIRSDHHIQGTICDDCICMSFLQPLALCQMHRELNQKGYA